MGSTPQRPAGAGAGSSWNRAGAGPQVALGAGRMDAVRPLRVRAARWDSLHVRRSDGPPMAGQVEGRLSGEPPHKSKTNSFFGPPRSEEHTSELQSRGHLVCRLLLEKKKQSDNVSSKIVFHTQ